MCGRGIDGSTSTDALCAECVKTSIDISEGIARESTIHPCKECGRWLQPPHQWVVAAPESRELLSLCLRKLNIPNRVKLVDAQFLWTEPHSKRVKVKVTIQGAVGDGKVLQQSFQTVYVVATMMCPDCQKSYTHAAWKACVQVRQKVQHKRTFLYLEQLILKHGAHSDTLNIKDARDGTDFYFGVVAQAKAFLSFLASVVPIETKESKEHASTDVQNNVTVYRYTWSATIVPICKDDLVALPINLARSLGNISPLVLCHRIGTFVYLLDPNTLQTAELSNKIFWRSPFAPLADAQELVEFVVLDVEPTPIRKGKWHVCEVTVAPVADLGVSYFTRTHLGGLLNPGDSVMGYLLTGSNFNDANLDALEQSRKFASTIPDVVLVKKHFSRRRRNRQRSWKLKRLAKEESEMLPKKADQERMDREYEMFLQDVEEDGQLRAAMNIYKSSAKKPDPDEMSIEETDDDDDDLPQINADELLEDFEDLTLEDS
jgi:nonsense-mediated mRNA decay protein 3